MGVKAAIQRRQMMLAVDGGRIVAAVRFYVKKSGEVSLYQFAVEPGCRGQRLSRALFDAVRQGKPMRSFCPAEVGFNRYYERTGWVLDCAGGGMNQWVLRA